ncbi:hypothetical protein L6452_20686 [Arctium lappa]|uniref:Uncharacterized protein n=1 Tax=Arctium lappa TaxID=4217 RepID=A0ACB9BC21_ARCLA|nr:hypothetical protein L6452_20686 [Arctium lappa]
MMKLKVSQSLLYWNLFVRYNKSRAFVDSPTISSNKPSNFIKSRARFNKFVRNQCRIGFKSVDDARVLFDEMIQMQPPRLAMELLKKMQSCGQDPDLVTYSILLDGLFKNKYHKKAMRLFREMEDAKLDLDVVVYGILIDGLCKARKLESAKDVFHCLLSKGIKPNTRIYNILIDGLFKGGPHDEAILLFQEMAKRGCCIPDGCTYNIVIQGLVRNDDVTRAIEFLHEMVGKGFSADASTVEILLDLSNDKNLDGSVLQMLCK